MKNRVFTPIYEAMKQESALNRAPFHTPGHKNAPGALPPDLLGLDYTELPVTGSLFDSTGPFPMAESLAARAFGAAATLLSAGGCTLCIQTMLRLAAPLGGKIVCGRNAHRAAVNTMALLGLTPVWAMPGGLLQAVLETPQLTAAYVTSPDYYGRMEDIPALADACAKRGIPLLVDNAHGAHLAFTAPNMHPLFLGASMTACSAHKTLNVLTGGAWLHLADSAYAEESKAAMALFASTSPSFPILASLDLARAWLEENGLAAFAALQERTAAIKMLAMNKGLALENVGDPTRLTLSTASMGMGAAKAGDFFRARGVEPELADGVGVVFICTPWNTEEDFSRLEAAVRALPNGKPAPVPALPPIPRAALSLRDAILSPQEQISLENAVGRVAAQAACPCPPGVPVVMPGEYITKESAEFLRGYGFFEIKVLK